jgi:hypothetical protein
MTVLAAPVKRGGLLYPLPPSDGISPAAELLRHLIEGARSELATSIAISRTAETAIAGLKRLLRIAAKPNWDGYGALPLDPRSAEQALRFIQALPTTVPTPDVSADPDGEVDLLWQLEPTRTISVSVGPNGKLTYAALMGTAQAYGTEWLSNEIPQPILESLTRILHAGK